MSENVKFEIEFPANLYKAVQRTCVLYNQDVKEFIVESIEEIIKSYVDEGFSCAGLAVAKEVGALINHKAP